MCVVTCSGNLCCVLSCPCICRYRRSSCENSISPHGNDSLSKFCSVQFLLSLYFSLQSCKCTWMCLTVEVPLLYSNLIIIPVALLAAPLVRSRLRLSMTGPPLAACGILLFFKRYLNANTDDNCNAVSFTFVVAPVSMMTVEKHP